MLCARWRLVPLFVVLSIGVGSAKGDQTETAKDEAEKLFRAAESFFEAGQYAEAADNFERAYRTLPLPAIAFSAAQAYRLQYFKDNEDAVLKRSVELYDLYIKEQKKGGRIKDAVALLAELKPLLAQAERRGVVGQIVRREKTGIVVTSQVEGAKASVNGSAASGMPLALDVKPGKHTVEIKADGYAPLSKTVDVVAGQVLAVEGELKALPGQVAVKTTPGAQISVDGKVVGIAPLPQPIKVGAGEHFVAVTQRGHRARGEEVVSLRGETIELDLRLRRTRQRKISYVVLASGGVFIISSALAALAAAGADGEARVLDELRQTRSLTTSERDAFNRHLDDRSRFTTMSLAFLGVGLGVAAVGGILYVQDNSTPEQPQGAKRRAGKDSVAVTPVASANAAGLVVSGHF